MAHARTTRTLKNVVGADTYKVWVAMLRDLVPTGRTQRLGPMIAGMLQYAASRASESTLREVEGSEAWSLMVASEMVDPEEARDYVEDLLACLFKDARVKANRTSARGSSYSVIEETIQEFVRWDLMPWE